MNRRTFIRRGLVGGALLALSSATGLFVWPSAVTRRPRRPLRALDERHFAILAAIASRTVMAPAADPIEIAHRIDEQIAWACPEARGDFQRLLLLFDNALAGLILDGRARPFTRLSPAAQDEVLAHWQTSRLAIRRSGYTVLRKSTQSAWYAAPAAWEDTGYPGPPTLVQR
jgi:hypothetical protein